MTFRLAKQVDLFHSLVLAQHDASVAWNVFVATVGIPLFRWVFAEFERCMIRDRVNTGMARARANGVKFGRGNRKDGSRSSDEERWGMSTAAMHKRIKQLHKGGMGMLKIGRELGVGTGFVQRVLNAPAATEARP